jgi:hypothetical protein
VNRRAEGIALRSISIKRLYRKIGKLLPADAYKLRLLISEMYGETSA